MASHNNGINKLPKWDPSNPLRYNYDAKSYDAKDYQAFKEARIAFQAKTPRPPEPFGRNSDLAKQSQRATTKEVNTRVAKRVPKNAKLVAQIDSTCLESLSWKNGVAHAVFLKRDPGGGYFYEMTKAEFLDWINSDSIGKYGNAEVF